MVLYPPWTPTGFIGQRWCCFLKRLISATPWPEGCNPGFCDSFASEEVIMAGLSLVEIWLLLNTPTL
ncbi:MAG TPA: hypothetical protein DEF05_05755 [Erwinia sp.]|uniref:hypothetical protein n=1 Tax=Erwinia citreus TaxID=558 RepID=UPI000E9C59C4|nr:hypothetical protein [Erwinia sp.]HBV39188.1 hypothetical protein [Erwinia sp.]